MNERSVWSPAQQRLVKRLAGKVAPPEIVRRLARHGAPRTRRALQSWAAKHHIEIRVRRPYREPTWRAYTWSEDAIVRAHYSRLGARLTAAILHKHGYERPARSVEMRAHRLGLVVTRPGLAVYDLLKILPFGEPKIRAWIEDGTIRAEQVGGRAKQYYRVSEDELRRFIRAEIWRFDWRRVRPGPWQVEAKAAHLKAQVIGVPEAARILGAGQVTVLSWIQAGYVAGARQNAPLSPWRLPRASLAVLDEILKLSQTERRRLLAQARQQDGAA
jgi:hypothetical protein